LYLGKTIWILGSSIIKQAFIAARLRPEGANLCLEPNIIWWQGYSGLTLAESKKKFLSLANVGNSPDYIVLHLGGNDLGRRSLVDLRKLIVELFRTILSIFPSVKIVWSAVLPRSNWRYSDNKVAMDKARKRLNSHGSSRALACGGHYLANSDFGKFEEHLFEKDRVHLSTLGTDIFLSNMSAGLEKFIKHNTPIHY
jgi:lysophospholipase L1-like esterase